MTLVVVTAVQLLAEPLVRLFDDSEQVVRDGVLYLRLCCGANSLVYAAMYTLDSFAIGVGAPKVALLNALLDALLIRLAHGARPARPLPGSGHFPRPPSLSGHDLFQKPRLGAKKASFTHRRIL